jgi:nitrilase
LAMGDETITLAAVQAAPVWGDTEACVEKACAWIERAGAEGTDLAVFGEVWIPGYPFFHRPLTTPAAFDLAASYLAAAVPVPGPATERLCRAARRANTDAIIGVLERDPAGGSVYATALLIGREGRLVGRHRKLKPTFYERLVWAEGDAAGLVVHRRPYASVSALNCWEHQMVLPGYALMAQGTEVHAALWPGREPQKAPATPVWPRQLLLSRAFATQGACYVVMAGGLIRPEDVPERYREFLSVPYTGDSALIGPTGEVLATAPSGEETILSMRVSLQEVQAAKVVCDVAGHYSRPDLFTLEVNRRPWPRVRVANDEGLPLDERADGGLEPAGAPGVPSEVGAPRR